MYHVYITDKSDLGVLKILMLMGGAVAVIVLSGGNDSKHPEWKEYMGDFKEGSKMTESDDLTLYGSSNFLAHGKIELLDMKSIHQKYPELPQDINGYLIYPPLDIKHTKFNIPFSINKEFKARVDALPSTDLIVYFNSKAHDMIDDAVTFYMATHQKSEIKRVGDTVETYTNDHRKDCRQFWSM